MFQSMPFLWSDCDNECCVLEISLHFQTDSKVHPSCPDPLRHRVCTGSSVFSAEPGPLSLARWGGRSSCQNQRLSKETSSFVLCLMLAHSRSNPRNPCLWATILVNWSSIVLRYYSRQLPMTETSLPLQPFLASPMPRVLAVSESKGHGSSQFW